MARRLNVWDFDDTLAWSSEAVQRFKRKNPDVESWKWWHDPDISTEAALETLPITDMWERMDKTPGEHWVLTGRVARAVKEWMKIWRDHPEIGDTVRKIDKVISTSGPAAKHLTVAIKKRRELKKALEVYDEIHFYDDHRLNLDAVADLSPNIFPHYVQNGRVVNASKVTFDDKNYRLLSHAIQSVQEMEDLSDKRTFREILRSAIGVFRNIQKDMTSDMSNLDLLEYVSQQLASNKIDFKTGLSFIADELDAGRKVDVEFDLDRKQKDFYGHPIQDVKRAAHTLSLKVENAFDWLQTPIVCKVKKFTYMPDSQVPTGFEAEIWRME